MIRPKPQAGNMKPETFLLTGGENEILQLNAGNRERGVSLKK